ncbi:MAG: HD-GYP domain-containing protein (c-di-GMP phosphodiesterase class II) [Chlamydiales bacterium]|jgi:HD-GYP domain-containing protein (c-di-GMP phosphodiesterase class II)
MDFLDKEKLFERFNKLVEIGLALSAEKDHNVLLEKILFGAKSLTRADGGTLYSVTDRKTLKFEIINTDSLGIHQGGSTNTSIDLPDVPLYERNNEPNEKMVSAFAVVNDKTVVIEDVYAVSEFDFSGTRFFDKKMAYRSKSFMTVPMKNHENEVIGVLQLLNAKDEKTGETVPFSKSDQLLVESLASQAAVAMTQKGLIDTLNQMLESFIQAIADAIDEKSPHTGHHCRRVPIISNLLAEAVNDTNIGRFKDLQFSEDEMYELNLAAWMHDCGKVTSPIHIVDKGRKLQTIFDRIHLIDTRFIAMKSQAEVEYLKKRMDSVDEGKNKQLEEEFHNRLSKWESDQEFLHKCNRGCEKGLSAEEVLRIKQISSYQWTNSRGETEAFLSEDEVENLSIFRGTLSESEVQVIRNHVVSSIKMLERLPYPKRLSRIPEIAGSHHERLDGMGYPNGITGEQMSVQSKILCIADVFEALTAEDRPYKKKMQLSESLNILKECGENGHLDPDLLELFIRSKVYVKYAQEHMSSGQVDCE